MAKSINEYFKNIRLKADMSQGELAAKMGYTSSQFVSNWERGLSIVPLHKAVLFCKITGTNVKDFKAAMIEESTKRIERVFTLHSKNKKTPVVEDIV